MKKLLAVIAIAAALTGCDGDVSGYSYTWGDALNTEERAVLVAAGLGPNSNIVFDLYSEIHHRRYYNKVYRRAPKGGVFCDVMPMAKAVSLKLARAKQESIASAYYLLHKRPFKYACTPKTNYMQEFHAKKAKEVKPSTLTEAPVKDKLSIADMETLKEQARKCSPAKDVITDVFVEGRDLKVSDWDKIAAAVNFCQKAELMNIAKD